MENLTRPIDLTQIVYPVYSIGYERPSVEEGVSLFIRVTTHQVTYRVLDDTSLPQPTLALRRLALLKQGVPLKKLSKAVFFLGDLIKIAKATTWFVDSNGLVFQYKKRSSCKLIFKKISYVHTIPTGGAILEIEGIPSRFKCLFHPKETEKYAGVLVLGLSYVLYGVYAEKYDDTRRNV